MKVLWSPAFQTIELITILWKSTDRGSELAKDWEETWNRLPFMSQQSAKSPISLEKSVPCSSSHEISCSKRSWFSLALGSRRQQKFRTKCWNRKLSGHLPCLTKHHEKITPRPDQLIQHEKWKRTNEILAVKLYKWSLCYQKLIWWLMNSTPWWDSNPYSQ